MNSWRDESHSEVKLIRRFLPAPISSAASTQTTDLSVFLKMSNFGFIDTSTDERYAETLKINEMLPALSRPQYNGIGRDHRIPLAELACMKREFDLPLSHMAIHRIWRQHGLIRKRRKKYQRKQDLAAVKATWRLFQQISADTKDLCDIPHFWPQAERLRLPLVQYTAREVRSGLMFWAFAQRRSAAASSVFAARVQRHLDRYGICLRDLAWQTDNGAEFIGSYDSQGRRTGSPASLGPSEHLRIPPAAHTYQSDVETVHRLGEDELFDLERFASRGEFLAKAHTYQLYFNLARLNSHKEHQSPWQIIERLAPRSPLELCLLPPVFLDYYINDQGGYDLPSHP